MGGGGPRSPLPHPHPHPGTPAGPPPERFSPARSRPALGASPSGHVRPQVDTRPGPARPPSLRARPFGRRPPAPRAGRPKGPGRGRSPGAGEEGVRSREGGALTWRRPPAATRGERDPREAPGGGSGETPRNGGQRRAHRTNPRRPRPPARPLEPLSSAPRAGNAALKWATTPPRKLRGGEMLGLKRRCRPGRSSGGWFKAALPEPGTRESFNTLIHVANIYCPAVF